MKNILITQKVKKDKFSTINYIIEKNWYDLFKSKKINLIPVNKKINLKDKQLSNITGVIIHGGNDLPINKRNDENIIRKKNDVSLIKYALKKKIPILAVCYGFQLIANMYGYKLKKKINHVNVTHTLNISLASQKKSFLKVNSYHNYVIFKLPNFFSKLVKHDDGSIELAISKNNKILCTMFHPERNNINQKKIKKMIFKHFNI
jgi:gamma-glutamyl-gamma-aminobutyrate hydrolase PuuD